MAALCACHRCALLCVLTCRPPCLPYTVPLPPQVVEYLGQHGPPAWYRQKQKEARRRARDEARRRRWRVVVVGAGPAGLTAALHLKVWLGCGAWLSRPGRGTPVPAWIALCCPPAREPAPPGPSLAAQRRGGDGARGSRPRGRPRALVPAGRLHRARGPGYAGAAAVAAAPAVLSCLRCPMPVLRVLCGCSPPLPPPRTHAAALHCPVAQAPASSLAQSPMWSRACAQTPLPSSASEPPACAAVAWCRRPHPPRLAAALPLTAAAPAAARAPRRQLGIKLHALGDQLPLLDTATGLPVPPELDAAVERCAVSGMVPPAQQPWALAAVPTRHAAPPASPCPHLLLWNTPVPSLPCPAGCGMS